MNESKTKTQKVKQAKSCRRKKKYKTKEEAQSRACYLYKKGLNLKPYVCNVCGGYHLCKVSWKTSLDRAFKEAGLMPCFRR